MQHGILEPFENPGPADHPRHHHAAEEQGERTTGRLHDLDEIASIEDIEHDQDADPEQGRDHHIDDVERNQQDDRGEDAEGQIDLYVGHGRITQSMGRA